MMVRRDDLVNELCRGIKITAQHAPPPTTRQASAQLAQAIFEAEADLEVIHQIDLLEELLKMLDNEVQLVRLAGWNAINTLVKTRSKEELPQFIETVRSGIKRMKDDACRQRDVSFAVVCQSLLSVQNSTNANAHTIHRNTSRRKRTGFCQGCLSRRV